MRFNQTTYSVVEGEKSVSITLVAAADHDFSFSVTVSTRDGTASCEWQAAVYGQTCLIHIAHNFLCNSISFVHFVITVNCYSSTTISLSWAKTILVFYHPSASSDYSSLRRSVSFQAGVNEVSFTVTIRDEGLIESDEQFYIELEIPSSAASSNVVKASPGNATVIIQDDDSECCLKCYEAEHNQNILIATNVHLNIAAL